MRTIQEETSGRQVGVGAQEADVGLLGGLLEEKQHEVMSLLKGKRETWGPGES